MYKTKLFYISIDWPGSSLLRGLRGKPSITYPMCKFWFTWWFVFFFDVDSFGFETCPESAAQIISLAVWIALSHFPALVWGVKVARCKEVGRAKAQTSSYSSSLLTWNIAERGAMSYCQNSSWRVRAECQVLHISVSFWYTNTSLPDTSMFQHLPTSGKILYSFL